MITFDTSWNLKAQAQYMDSSNELIKSSIIGKFNPQTITGKEIQSIIVRLLEMTNNTYVDANLTADKII